MKILLVIISACILFMISCSSPTDVPANREVHTDITNGNKENQPPAISVNTNELIFYDVPLQGSQSKHFTLSNNKNEKLSIDQINFRHYGSMFRIWSPDVFPITLGPKNGENSSVEVFITFTGNSIGEFIDTLFFKGYDEPFIRLHAIVPSVDVMDLDFGFVEVNKTNSKALLIKNNADETAIIRGYSLIDPDSVYSALTKLPSTIEPGQSLYFILRFSPKEDKPYNARIEFDIMAPGFIDNDADISGAGLKS